jgi:predicted NAD-dependent protein-ADP-ribosyltransferase YbiA (DUF1768 family)
MTEQRMMLSSPKAQPFGLLSSRAEVDFIVGSKEVPEAEQSFKHGEWKTVTQYVYVNMFKDLKTRHRMSEMLTNNAFNNLLRIRQEEDSEIYHKEIIKGLRERFKQREQLRIRLFQTRGSQLVCDNKDVVSLLNQLRSLNNDTVFDPKMNREVKRIEVLQVIHGVQGELLKNPHLPDNLDYDDLKRYAKQFGYQDLPINDDIFLNINHIVPVLKFRMRNRIWADEINKFKDHLLDVYLDSILEREYPNLYPSQYGAAKRQQIEKEKRLQVYKDQLYDLYLKGFKGDEFHKLQFTPDKALFKMGRSAEEINELLLRPAEQTPKIIITEDDPFHPHFIEDVNIDGHMFRSAVHYAYFQMISNLMSIGMLPGFNFDINSFSIQTLFGVFNNIKDDWIKHNLKVNNEIANGSKFDQYPTLIHLLLATRDTEIIWNDRSDPILGIGSDSRGENNTGKLLEFIRNGYRNVTVPTVEIATVGTKNVWVRFWMTNIAQDLKNTLVLIKKPTTQDLEVIYDVKPIMKSPSPETRKFLKRAGLDDKQIEIAFPIIIAMSVPMIKKTDQQAVRDEADAYFDHSYAGRRELFEHDLEVAIKRLKNIAGVIEPDANPDKFAISILANKQTENKNDVRWSRVFAWSH